MSVWKVIYTLPLPRVVLHPITASSWRDFSAKWSSDGFYCCHCKVNLSCTTTTGANSAIWKHHHRGFRESHCQWPIRLDRKCPRQHLSTQVRLNIHWVLLSFVRLYDSSRAKMFSGSYFWFSVRFITWWLRQKKRNSILHYRKTIQSFQDCRWQFWSSNSMRVHISAISHPYVWQAMVGENKSPLSGLGHQSLKANRDTSKSPLKLKICKLLSLTEAAGDATGRKAASEEEMVLLSYHL